MMSTVQKRVLLAGIRIKLGRGEQIEDILSSYVNLSDEEKQEIRIILEG